MFLLNIVVNGEITLVRVVSDVTRILYLIFKYPMSALFRRINTLCERILSF